MSGHGNPKWLIWALRLSVACGIAALICVCWMMWVVTMEVLK